MSGWHWVCLELWDVTCLESCEVNDTVNGRVLLEDLVESLLIDNVGLVELGSLAADELDTVESDLGGVVQVIDNHHIVSVLEQCQRGERANVAGTTAMYKISYYSCVGWIIVLGSPMPVDYRHKNSCVKAQEKYETYLAKQEAHPVTRTVPTGAMT